MKKLLILPLLITLPLFGAARRRLHHNCKHDVAKVVEKKSDKKKKDEKKKEVKRVINYQLVIKEY